MVVFIFNFKKNQVYVEGMLKILYNNVILHKNFKAYKIFLIWGD
jgi:hypothetical protein